MRTWLLNRLCVIAVALLLQLLLLLLLHLLLLQLLLLLLLQKQLLLLQLLKFSLLLQSLLFLALLLLALHGGGLGSTGSFTLLRLLKLLLLPQLFLLLLQKLLLLLLLLLLLQEVQLLLLLLLLLLLREILWCRGGAGNGRGACQRDATNVGIGRVLLDAQCYEAVDGAKNQLGDLLRLQIVHGAAVHLAQQVAGGGDLTRKLGGASLPEPHNFDVAGGRGLEHKSNANFFVGGPA